MASSDAGKASNLTMGQSLGATKDPIMSKTAGVNLGIIGTAPRGGKNIRDIPLLVRDKP